MPPLRPLLIPILLAAAARAAEPRTVAVTLVDPAGRPAAGAVVERMTTDGPPQSPAGRADAAGVVRLNVDADERAGFVATAPGAAPTPFGFWGAVPDTYRVTLPPAAQGGGRLRDAAGAPVGGAVVKAQWSSMGFLMPYNFLSGLQPFTYDQTAVTDADGHFAFDVFQGPMWELNAVRADAVAAAAGGAWVADDTGALRAGRLELSPASLPGIRTRFGSGPATRPTVATAALPQLAIRLHAVDAATGRPVSPLRVSPGGQWTANDFRRTKTERELTFPGPDVTWHFTDGCYGYFLRVRADGYADAVTRVVKSAEASVDVELRLTPAVPRDFDLRTPDGRPAAGARAYLATPTRPLNDVDFDVVPDASNAFDNPVVATSGPDGRLTLVPPAEPYRLAIGHESGWAEVDPATLAAGAPVTLTPWASVTLHVRSADGPAAGVSVQPQSGYGREADCPINWGGTSLTDAAGVARLPHTRPGSCFVTMFARPAANETPTWRVLNSGLVLEPGDRRDVTLMNGPHAVGATLTQLPGMNWSVNLTPLGPPTTLPAGLDTMTADDRDKAVRRAIAAAPPAAGPVPDPLRQLSWDLRPTPAGKVGVAGLFPGTYRLWAYVVPPNRGGNPTRLDRYFVLPAGGPATVDLGVIRPTGDVPVLPAGAAVPDLAGTTADGKAFRLADLRGRWVLLDFWGTWCGFCVADEPAYKDAYDGWAADGRLTIVGVSVDDTPQQVRDHVARHALPWTQVVLGDREHTDVPRRFGVEGYPTVLLVAPDGTVAATDLGDVTLRQTLTEKIGPATTRPQR